MPLNNPFDIFKQAYQDVQENARPLLVYTGFHVVASGLALPLRFVEFQYKDINDFPAWLDITSLFVSLASLAVLSVGASVAFARMGRQIDRPLWKQHGDGEAVRRFFLIWFILGLAYLAADRLVILLYHATGDAEAVLGLQTILFVLVGLMIPVGACIMFNGKLEWRRLGEDLTPLGRQIPATSLLVLFGFFAGSFILTSQAMLLRPEVRIYLSVPGFILLTVLYAYCDCLIFAGTVELCRADRDTAEEDDFDF